MRRFVYVSWTIIGTHKQKHQIITCVCYTNGKFEEIIEDINLSMELQWVLTVWFICACRTFIYFKKKKNIKAIVKGGWKI